MNKQTRTYLQKNKPASLKREESVQLWNNIARELSLPTPTVEATATYRLPLLYQPAFAFAAGVLLMIGSNVAAYEADSAGPGQLLYTLDRALEEMHLAISPKAKQMELRYEYALERVTELAALLTTTQSTDSPALTQYIAEVQQYITDTLPLLSPEQRVRVEHDLMVVTVEPKTPAPTPTPPSASSTGNTPKTPVEQPTPPPVSSPVRYSSSDQTPAAAPSSNPPAKLAEPDQSMTQSKSITNNSSPANETAASSTPTSDRNQAEKETEQPAKNDSSPTQTKNTSGDTGTKSGKR